MRSTIGDDTAMVNAVLNRYENTFPAPPEPTRPPVVTEVRLGDRDAREMPTPQQQPMPDRDHAPAFWDHVARAYAGNGSVVFELFNEPYPDSNANSEAAWTCWRDGGSCPGVSYTAAGMQELVPAGIFALRSTN